MSGNHSLKWLLATLALFSIPDTGWGLPWDKDMFDQPSIKPQETAVKIPPSSIPLGAVEPLPVPQTVGELVAARMAAAALVNPVPVTPGSLAKGKFFYQIYCLVCHGQGGRGDGPVGKKFVPPPMNLTLAYVQRQPEGQLFYTITHGSVVMPYYRDAMSVEERWHLVNYLKGALVQP
jgi:mono/diheme cytochrome c family protein